MVDDFWTRRAKFLYGRRVDAEEDKTWDDLSEDDKLKWREYTKIIYYYFAYNAPHIQ